MVTDRPGLLTREKSDTQCSQQQIDHLYKSNLYPIIQTINHQSRFQDANVSCAMSCDEVQGHDKESATINVSGSSVSGRNANFKVLG